MHNSVFELEDACMYLAASDELMNNIIFYSNMVILFLGVTIFMLLVVIALLSREIYRLKIKE